MCFRLHFRAKKPLPASNSHHNRTKPKKRWSHLIRSVNSNSNSSAPPAPLYRSSGKVAESAEPAAHAAASFGRLTSGDDGARLTARERAAFGMENDLMTAAVKIQSAFRAYLSRRALRALRGVVKVQALVRGYFVRKRTSDTLRRMHALIKAQTRARVERVHNSQSPFSSSYSFSHFTDSPIPGRFIHKLEAKHVKLDSSPVLKRCASNSNVPQRRQHLISPKSPQQWIQTPSSHETLEIHTLKSFFSTPNQPLNPRSQKHTSSVSSHETNEESIWCSAVNSPQVYSASSRFSCGARKSLFDGSPNYMANTESSRAKVRSVSVPKQGIELNRKWGGGNRSKSDWNVDHMGTFCSNSFDDMVSFL